MADASVDWAAARLEWEQTGISDRALAAKLGLKSGTSIERKRKAEGWTRDAETMEARVVTAAVVGTQSEVPTPAHTPLTRENLGYPPEGEVPVGTKRPDLPRFEPVKVADRVRMPTSEERAQAAQQAEVFRASKVAIQAQATNRQLRTADQLYDLFEAFYGLLMTIATSNDLAALADARDRLLGMNADRETMAGVMKSAQGILSEAHKLQRQALGMGVVEKPAEQQVTQDAVDPRALLRHMSPEAMFGLGEAVERMMREKPVVATIEGNAEEKTP